MEDLHHLQICPLVISGAAQEPWMSVPRDGYLSELSAAKSWVRVEGAASYWCSSFPSSPQMGETITLHNVYRYPHDSSSMLQSNLLCDAPLPEIHYAQARSFP